ncbi:MAG: TonB-dependent receptor [Dysgonamonadaceae bacterium]|jgi:TonB-linked SusC/RagA family outer membrane protein|nr:TonB-dependent receptor [Dysgonamonadaceae bacterium]
MRKKFIGGILCILMSTFTAFAQHKVSGTVTDARGDALIGVSIVEKGTTNRATTGMEGKFIITVSQGAVLQFAYIGYVAQEIVVGNQTQLQIAMSEDLQSLDEVVVVGFATQKKVNLTGSVSTVSSKQLESVPVANAVLALQGQVPGLTIKQHSGELYGKNPSMELRGLATIGQGSSGGVLVLIDGMEGDLYSINPQDIENISILKDAAASSIYGSRAPFGVILVTTKKGKEGKISINYNNSFRFNTPINMPKMADSYSWALYFNDCAHNQGYGNDIGPERLQRIKDYIDGKISYNTIPVGNMWGTAYTEGNDNIDYYDVFFKDLTTAQEHNFSVTGGNAKMNYFVSANYLKENGVLEWDLDGLNRYNVFGKIEAKPLDFLSIQYSSRLIRENYHKPRFLDDNTLYYFGQWLWPVGPLYDPNGLPFNDTMLNMRDGGQLNISNTTTAHQFNFVLEPLKGWRIVGDLNYRYFSYFNKSETKMIWQTCIDGVTPGSKWYDHTSVAEDAGRNEYINGNVYTDYEHTFADRHYLKVMSGFQAEQYNTHTVYASKEGLIVPDIATINTASGLFNGTAVPPVVSGGYSRWRTAGFFGRLNYNYMEKYLFEANLRYDGSSRFRNDNRWGLFPSFSLGYNIAKEDFFQPLASTVNMLKLRASYGSLGNQNTNSYYPTYEAMGFANSAGPWLINGQKPNIAWPPSLISASLSWEEIQSKNIGLDFSLFNNRLTGFFDYFIRNTLNMIGPADELPVILGTSVPNTNNTDLESKGFEIELAWRDRAFSSLDYGIRLLLSDAQATITRYSNPSGTLDRYYTGKMWGEIWGYESTGIARSDEEMQAHLATLPNGGQDRLGSNWQAGDVMYQDINGDGYVDWGSNTIDDHGDLKVIGNTTPRYNFGIDLTAAWKGIDFRMFLQGVGKRDIWQGGRYFFGNGGMSKWGTMVMPEHLDYFRDDVDHPLGQNIDSYYPRPYFDNGKNFNTQTLYLQNAAYMRLKNLQIGYSLPQVIISKAGIQNLRIYFSGENLLTFTKMTKLFDPETIGENFFGNVYPLTKTYSVGLSVTF